MKLVRESTVKERVLLVNRDGQTFEVSLPADPAGIHFADVIVGQNSPPKEMAGPRLTAAGLLRSDRPKARTIFRLPQNLSRVHGIDNDQ